MMERIINVVLLIKSLYCAIKMTDNQRKFYTNPVFLERCISECIQLFRAEIFKMCLLDKRRSSNPKNETCDDCISHINLFFIFNFFFSFVYFYCIILEKAITVENSFISNNQYQFCSCSFLFKKKKNSDLPSILIFIIWLSKIRISDLEKRAVSRIQSRRKTFWRPEQTNKIAANT